MEPIADTAFVCACEQWSRSACKQQELYQKYGGKSYCVLHFPGNQKSEAFKQALQRKIESKDFDFRGVWFPDSLSFKEFDFGADADFRDATFNEKVNFSGARFGTAKFDFVHFKATANFTFANFNNRAQFASTCFHTGAYFNRATFSEVADFGSARFCDVVYFGETSFQMANFSNASFNASLADFGLASFSGAANFNFTKFAAVAEFGNASFSADVHFIEASFGVAVDFSFATFKQHVRFAGKQGAAVFVDPSYLDLRFTTIEKPELVSFHTINLRPSWFINVDARKFEFSNVDWDWRSINKEIETLQNSEISSPYRMLAIACRHLAVNAEENHRYEEASKFRYMAMDTRRLKGLEKGVDVLHWLYWALSGYGERVLRAAAVLVGILIVSAAFYTQVGFARWEPRITSESEAMTAKRDEVGAPLKPARAITYSAAVMTVQRPEPRPVTTAAHTITLLESILGPVQAALLALAIRRKFMR